MVQRSRAQRLNGLFPLSYMGVVPVSPANFIMDDRPPTINDSKNFYIGDIWLDQSASPITAANIWMLVGLAGNIATWVNFCCGSGPSDDITFIGDTGPAITGISFLFSGGSTGLSFDGSGGNLMTLSFAGITANGGNISLSTDALDALLDIGDGAADKVVTLGSTTASSTTKLQSSMGGMTFLGVAGVAVSNKNYVSVNSVTGEVGSDGGSTSSISITGNTGGTISSSSFTFTGGSTGLSFDGVGNTFTLNFAGITANDGTVNLSTDNLTTSLNIGTGAGNKTVTLGSTNTTSTTNLQAGSGGIDIPAFVEGALITSTTGVISSVTGTVGDVLTANGAGVPPSFQSLGTGSKVLIERRQVTDVEYLDFVTGITGYSYYIMEAIGYVSNHPNNRFFRTYFSSDGGASWGAYQYQQLNMGPNSNQSTFVARAFGFNTAGNLWLGLEGPSQGGTSFGTQYLFNLGSSSAVKKSIIDGVNRSYGFGYAQQQRQVGATNSTAVVNGIRLSFGGGLGLINSGDFRLYGVV